MNVNKEWIAQVIDDLGEFGKTEKGITRLAYSDADVQASEYIINIMKNLGMKIRRDEMGNIIGKLEGTDKEAAVVGTGSHLDTVPQGGKYDGVVGVVGSLAAISCLKEKGPLKHPLEMIIFMAEESSRFGFATMGSKAIAGKANLQAWAKAKDQAGMDFPAVLNSRGYDFTNIPKVSRTNGEFKAFVEMHIEQGRVLEADNLTIGVVEAIAAPTRLKVQVKGFADHSGATPMHQRKDALTSAAELILSIEDIAIQHSDEGTVGTVGLLKVEPGAMNVVPGLVTMWVDIRGVDYESISETLTEFKDEVARIADERDILIVVDVLSSDRPVTLDEQVVNAVEHACRTTGVTYRRMNSGAGHDAMNMALIAPTGMIFIPCKQGISHNPEENASIDDIYEGVRVLTETLYNLAK